MMISAIIFEDRQAQAARAIEGDLVGADREAADGDQ
jgi:hypothetical protein